MGKANHTSPCRRCHEFIWDRDDELEYIEEMAGYASSDDDILVSFADEN